MDAMKAEKIQKLIQNEIEWAIDNGDSNWPETVSHWVMDLFTSSTDEEINRWYTMKFED
jgi:hypothetical protein